MSFGNFLGSLAKEGAKAAVTTAASAGVSKAIGGSGGNDGGSRGLGSPSYGGGSSDLVRFNSTRLKQRPQGELQKAEVVDASTVWDQDPDELTRQWQEALMGVE